jgi:hypothetical protein
VSALASAFIAIIGRLGKLIRLGDAVFRLPLLIGASRFVALQAVTVNKVMSVVVVASLPFRVSTVLVSSIARDTSNSAAVLCAQRPCPTADIVQCTKSDLFINPLG